MDSYVNSCQNNRTIKQQILQKFNIMKLNSSIFDVLSVVLYIF